jgi:hypothetical protein
MENRKPGAVPYIVAAVAIAATIWTTIGTPQDGLKTDKQKQHHAGRIAVP